MSMISHQIDELRVLEDWLRTTGQPRDALLVASAIYTIQALSEKVADQNLNRSEIPNSSDLISRQAALAEFVDGRDVYDIMESIESLPSAEPKTGKWKIDEYGIYHCPVCHAINNTVYKSFCPNCGAKMEI